MYKVTNLTAATITIVTGVEDGVTTKVNIPASETSKPLDIDPENPRIRALRKVQSISVEKVKPRAKPVETPLPDIPETPSDPTEG